MHWLAQLGDVTAGMSHAFLSGRLTAEHGQSAPGSSIFEHYLCSEHADVDPQNDAKIKSFFSRAAAHPDGSQDPYVLYPRAKINVSLSSIFAFLTLLSPTIDWHVYWTCCRGYIGQHNPFEAKFTRGQVMRVARVDPPATPALTDQGHQTLDAGFETVVMVAKSDKDVIEAHRDFSIGRGTAFEIKGNYTKAIKALLQF
jgi:hypothetical protein